MKKKPRISLARSIPVLMLCLLCLISTVHADVGPKEALCITVVNAPAGETVYIDLLAQGNPAGERPWNFEAGDHDEAIVARLLSLEGNGWVLAVITGVYGSAPIFGDVRPQEDGTYSFSYFGLPKTFRLAAATAGEAKAMDNSFTRTRFYTNVVYDWAANTLTYATPTPLLRAAHLASTLIPTLVIEGLVLWLFGFRSKRSWLVFLCVNMITQIALHLVCGAIGMPVTQAAYFWMFYLFLLVPELVIWGVEAAAYGLLLSEHSRGRRVGYAFAANIVSYAVSYLPLHLLYEPFSRL